MRRQNQAAADTTPDTTDVADALGQLLAAHLTTAQTPVPPPTIAQRAKIAAEKKAFQERMARGKRVAAYRRAQALPHKATAVTGAAGALAWGMAEAAPLVGLPGIAVTAAAALASAATVTVGGLVARRRKVLADQWRRRYWTAGTVSAIWVILSSISGLTPEMLAALVGAEAVLGARWWRQHRIPALPPADHPAALLDPAKKDVSGSDDDAEGDVLAPEDDVYAQRFRTRLAKPHKKLAKAELYNREETEFGVSYTLQLDPSRHTFSTVLNLITQIAAALEIAPTEVMPSKFDSQREDRIRLEIVTNSPIKGPVEFTGPRWVDLPDGTGACDIGPYGDGRGAALYRTYTSSGVCSGHIAGVQGSGKSACLNNIAISQRASGKVIHVYLDGAPAGGSSPFLSDFAHYAGHGHDGAEKVLALAEAWADWRAQENIELGLEGQFIASAERPVIQIIIDEAHEVFADPDHAARWLALLRIIRKLGIAVLTASQGLGVADFGNNRELRKLLIAWNLFCFRTSASSDKGLVPGLEQVDPSQLPAIPGYAVCGAHGLGARIAPLRAAYTDDWEQYAAPLPEPQIDQIARLAADTAMNGAQLWTRRDEAQTILRSQALANLAALRAGTWTPPTNDSTGDTATSAATGGSWAARTTTAQTAFQQLDSDGAFRRHLQLVPDTITTPAPETRPVDTSAAPAGLSPAEAAVWSAIADGHTSPVQIQQITGWKETYVRNQLKALMAAGHITQPAQWKPYEITSHTSATGT